MRKSCTYITICYANQEGNYQAIFTRCITRQKAEKRARKRKIEKDNKKAVEISKQYDLSIKELKEEPKEIEVDINLENWTENLLLLLFFIGKAEYQNLKHSQ